MEEHPPLLDKFIIRSERNKTNNYIIKFVLPDLIVKAISSASQEQLFSLYMSFTQLDVGYACIDRKGRR